MPEARDHGLQDHRLPDNGLQDRRPKEKQAGFLRTGLMSKGKYEEDNI
jgi:hypothetical protein